MTEFNALTDGSRMSEEEVNSKLELLPENVYEAIKDRLDEIPFEIRLALATETPLPGETLKKYGIPMDPAMSVTGKKARKKTMADLREMDDEELAEKVANLSPFVYDAIKDRLDEIPKEVKEALVQKIELPRSTMIRYGIPSNRHQMRVIALEALYANLLVGTDIRKALVQALCNSNQADGFLCMLTMDTVDNKEEFIETITPLLQEGWSFDRLPVIEQAILLMSCEEILEMGTEKTPVINEAVTLCKEYGDADSPKYVNAILDKIEG